MTIKGGTGSGEVNERHSVTILEGLRNRGFTIATQGWIDAFGEFYEKAKAEYQVEKRKRLNLLKLSSIMQMLFDNFRLPAGPAITEEYLSKETDACVYVLCDGVAYEAFCLENDRFAVNIPEGTVPQYVIYNIGGEPQMFEIN
jgi:hypothetical protein